MRRYRAVPDISIGINALANIALLILVFWVSIVQDFRSFKNPEGFSVNPPYITQHYSCMMPCGHYVTIFVDKYDNIHVEARSIGLGDHNLMETGIELEEWVGLLKEKSKTLIFALKIDGDASYDGFQKVTNALRKHRISRYRLIGKYREYPLNR